MNLFAKRSGSNVEQIGQVKSWVRELFVVGPEVAILVTELQCTEPGCPPLETVIAILEDQVAPRQYKLHRALAEVTREEVARLAAHSSRH